MKRCVMFCLLLTFLALPASAAAAPRVTAVTATVTAEHSLPQLVQQRMEKSVQTIADQLLAGRLLTEVASSRQADAALIQEVFDKVLVGYTVERVTIVPAEQTEVRVQLLPWSQTIQSVQVETSVEGMPPRVEALVQQDAQGVNQVFAAALTGLPLAATDWTNGVLKHQLNAYLEKHLPEFRGDFELVPAEQAKVRLVLYPRLPVVRTVNLSMRSDTVPNMALLQHRPLMQAAADSLVGVPVAFVARHQATFEQEFARALDAQPDFRRLAMRTQVKLTAGERLQLMSRSDTSRYRLRLTGWQDIGRASHDHADKDNLEFRLHAGAMLSQRDELFALLDVWPADMDWDWQLGLSHRFGKAWAPTGSVRYNLRRQRFEMAAYQPLTERLLLRYEYRFADHLGEIGLRYKLHDFLSLEYVIDKQDNWLRVLGNF